MGRVLTNNVGLAVVEETRTDAGRFDPNTSPGSVAAGEKFLNLEPNTLGTFGATIATTVRNPISPFRQRKMGTITDLDSSAEFEHDLVYDVVKRMMRGFMFAKGYNEHLSALRPTGITTTVITVPVPVPVPVPDTRTTMPKLAGIKPLIWMNGFEGEKNKGLKVLTENVVTSTTLTAGPGSFTAETSPKGIVDFVGVRLSIANEDWAYASSRATLTTTAVIVKELKKTLKPGQLVHIGSIENKGEGFQKGLTIASKSVYGYARVRSFGNTTIVFDKLSNGLKGTHAAAVAVEIDILYNDFIKPAKASDRTRYLEQSYMFELLHPNLYDGVGNTFNAATKYKVGDIIKDAKNSYSRKVAGEGGNAPTDTDATWKKLNGAGYVYSVGNFCNTMGINLPLTDKATISFAFIGTDTRIPTPFRNAGRIPSGHTNHAANAGYETAVDMVRTEAMNTVNDIARLRIADLDEEGLTTDFKSLTFNINNNVSPEKVLRCLGARYMNAGSFDISIETQCLFTNPQVLDAIRNNAPVSMDFILANNDGVLGFDIPGMTMGDGGREYPENESVLINFTCETFEDDVFKSSFSFSTIPVPLPTPEDC